MKINQKLIRITFILSFLINANVNAQPLLIATDVGAPCAVGINPDGTQNGKTFYNQATNTVGWSGTQWEWHRNGDLFATNSTNTSSLAPCSANFPWTLTTDGINTCGINNPNLEVRGNCAAALPVELMSFFSREINGSLKLFWNTATEINNEKFEIEQSQNGRDFTKIGEVMGMGTTVEQQDYSFEVKSPKNGILYYRLRQMDFDGYVEYSDMISVNFKGESDEVGEFYPNPSNSAKVNLDYISHIDEEIMSSVYDVTGKLLIIEIQQISKGYNNLRFDFNELNSGIYFVKIGDEKKSTYRKLIIER